MAEEAEEKRLKEAEEARQRREAEARRQKDAREARRRKEEAAAAAASTPIATDENVQFTVFRRSAIQPEHWYPLLCFAHLAERRPDAPDQPDPIEKVQAQARQILGEDIGEFRSATEDSGYPVAREGELRFVPGWMGWRSIRPNAAFCGLKASTAKTSGCAQTNQWTGVSLAAPSPFSMEVSCSPKCS